MVLDWFQQMDIAPVIQVMQKEGGGYGDGNDIFDNWLEDQKKRQQYSFV
jgi:hypothetical protein